MATELASQLASWGRSRPTSIDSFAADALALGEWHQTASKFLAEMASPAPGAVAARAQWREQVRRAHSAFIRNRWKEIVDRVPVSDPLSMSKKLGDVLPGLAATARELEEDARRPLGEKVGHEYKAAVTFSELLAIPSVGRALLAAARRPVSTAGDRLAELKNHDRVDLGGARIRRHGSAAIVELSNPAALNSENDTVLDALEACVDLALLDDRIEVGVLRGAHVQSPKYAGRRVFCSGLDLTGLYQGKLSCLYYLRRELGLVSKIYRGLASTDDHPEVEKPWIAAVDAHAIGGGCQLLLVADYVVAEAGSALSLPARAEGIIPGAANLRLPRFLGDRAARRLLLMDRALMADGPEGRLLVDEIVPSDRMNAAVKAAIATFVSSGLVSLAANRKALRIAEEPIDRFREYMSHFALAQADCHFDVALVRNLEQNWISRRAPGAA